MTKITLLFFIVHYLFYSFLRSTEISISQIQIKRGINIVYNLEVEDNHNYFVGKEHILVHNAPCIVGGEAPTEAPNSSNSVKLERKGN